MSKATETEHTGAFHLILPRSSASLGKANTGGVPGVDYENPKHTVTEVLPGGQVKIVRLGKEKPYGITGEDWEEMVEQYKRANPAEGEPLKVVASAGAPAGESGLSAQLERMLTSFAALNERLAALEQPKKKQVKKAQTKKKASRSPAPRKPSKPKPKQKRANKSR